ncbi:related to GTPase-activating protein of the rho/rac family (LRG1 protein) [Fusarium fujikuroi]|nr:related to GTPase-activating protein of the rho/rac family (LRG1 protein) [Fusarium fujikuroi]
MDPLSIASSVVGLTATCLSTCKKLHDLAGEYQDAPAIIATICSQSTIISIGLSELQMKILRRDDLAQAWASKTQIWTAFETALTACMVVFSCLEAETKSLILKNPGFWGKIRFIWNQERLKELLGALREQQSSITFLLNLLELETLSSIQKDILKNAPKIQSTASKAQSLRSCNPSVRMESGSIFDKGSANLSFFYPEAVSGHAPSELDFEFDNLVINSQAYRRAFIKARSESQPPQVEDMDSDIGTVKELDTPAMQPQKTATSIVSLSREKTISYAKDLVRPSVRNQDSENWTDLQIIRPVLLCDVATCYGCLRSITKDHLRALGGAWHVGCFRCYDCGVSLQTGYHLSEEETGIQPKPLCKDDYNRRQDTQCFKCQQLIIGDFVTVLGRRYHPTHFTCDRCEIIFTKESEYHEHNGGIYCMLHLDREAAYYCHACKFPIMEKYIEKDGEIAKWHTFCFELSSWGLELPVSANGHRYLASIQDHTIGGLSKFYPRLHDTRANMIYASGSSYMKKFRDSFTKYFNLTREGPRAETYAAFKVILAMLSCLLKAAAKATTNRAGEYAITRFCFHPLQYFVRKEQRLKASPEDVGRSVTDLLPPLLRIPSLMNLSKAWGYHILSNWKTATDSWILTLSENAGDAPSVLISSRDMVLLNVRRRIANCMRAVTQRLLVSMKHRKVVYLITPWSARIATGKGTLIVFLMMIARCIKYGNYGTIGMCDQMKEAELEVGDVVRCESRISGLFDGTIRYQSDHDTAPANRIKFK